MLTFQDFEKAKDKNLAEFIRKAIAEHVSSEMYKVAVEADEYDRQRNVTITNYVRTILSSSGFPVEDFTATNNKIASNFFHRLNTQRCTYSLGNGVTFPNGQKKRTIVQKEDDGSEREVIITVDKTKEALGINFDTQLKKAGYFALIHGISFGFWNYDRLHVFKLTEFVPLWDETNGVLRAGIRFWSIDKSKPTIATLYEEDGYTQFVMQAGDPAAKYELVDKKHGYTKDTETTNADGEIVVGEENYDGKFPIVPLWGSDLHQSTLVGMKCAIDSFDLIRSGFANDLSDCTQIYWIVENCAAMADKDLQRFRDKLKIQHIVEVGTGDDGAKITPYTQEIPFAARQAYLTDIRKGIYEDFGALDVHSVEADSTNDHLAAAYQPMDENADDFEYQIITFVQQILRLAGLPDDTPQFKRNRNNNVREQVEIVMMEAQYLDDETILNKLPNITPDEVATIMANRRAEDRERLPLVIDEEGEE